MAVLLASFAMGCRMYSPDAGHEILLVKKPIIFGRGGIRPEAVKTGLAVAAIATQGVDVHMHPNRYETELDDTITQDGFPISFQGIMVLKVTNSVNLIKDFGQNGTKTTSKSPSRPWSDRP